MEQKVKKVHVVDIVKHGKQFIIPDNINYDVAIELLQKKKVYEETQIEIIEDVDTFVWDGALAFVKAMEELYGWCSAEPEVYQGMFGGKEVIPPKMIQIPCGVDETVSVPWGQFTIPGIEGKLFTGSTKKKGRYIFSFRATIKRKFEGNIKELAVLTRKYAKENSIYKGKAIKMEFYDKNGNPYPLPTPSFIDVSKVKSEEIIFSKEVERNVTTNIHAPIKNMEMCKKFGIPLKRGILLSGTYGTGKTLVAYSTAKICLEHNWTFLMVENANEIKDMIDFAHQYQPAVVFCEDIDRVVGGERDVDMDAILNIIDGIESKNTDIMVVLTTNNVENIHKAMLRPGRLDAVINVLPPDAEAAERLMRMYGRGLIPLKENLKDAGKVMDGQIPAVIRECVERAKLFAINESNGKDFHISSSALLGAAESMKHQLDLLNRDSDIKPEKEKLTLKLISLLTAETSEDNKKILRKIEEVREAL